MMKRLIVVALACGGPQKPAAPSTWDTPAGWKTETFPFPLEFAPSLTHHGVEELRFAPGMFEPGKPGYWSYAFVWRLDDAADLAPDALAAELTAYYVGLEKAVDDKHRIANVDDTAVHVDARGQIAAHVFDAFATAQPLDLTGRARRVACGTGSLWVFEVAPATTGVHAELDALFAQAACGQQVVENKKK
jgi:hypothetical protein